MFANLYLSKYNIQRILYKTIHIRIWGASISPSRRMGHKHVFKNKAEIFRYLGSIHLSENLFSV